MAYCPKSRLTYGIFDRKYAWSGARSQEVFIKIYSQNLPIGTNVEKFGLMQQHVPSANRPKKMETSYIGPSGWFAQKVKGL